MSPLHDHLLFLFRFDTWANDSVAAALSAASEDGGGVPPAGPLHEATRLFAHLTRSSAVWLGRVQDTEAASLSIWPDATSELDPAAIAQHAARSAAAWRRHLRKATDADLGRGVRYENSRGARYETALTEIAAHVVNHGSHHRAQIARYLREAGVQPPVLDLIAYARSRERRLRDVGLLGASQRLA